MNQTSKTVRTTTTIVGKIGDVTVSINYENEIGKQPVNINANCSLPAALEGDQPTYINVNRQAGGQKSVSVNGDKPISEVVDLINAIKAELETIAAEGSAA